MPAILILCVILLPWLGALVVWLIGDKRENLQHGLAVAFSLLTAFSALILLVFSGDYVVLSIPFGDFFGTATFAMNGLGVFLAVIAAGIGSLTVIFSVDYMRGEKQLGRYYFLVLFFIGAMIGLVLSNSLLFLFFFWEITALCSYALISFDNDNPKAVAGGIKALVITQIGGVGLLAGALLIYANIGTFQIDELIRNEGLIPKDILTIIAFSFLVAAASKSAQIPFFTWLPDAMEAPTPISALIHAATMVNAGVYLLARFFPVFANIPGWKITVLLIGMVTLLLAAIMACISYDLKRVLAYSTVSQLGYMVYAIGVGGILPGQFHLLSHSIFKALLFLAAGVVIHTMGTRDMRKMGGITAQMPFTRTVFIIGSLALAGIPVLNGFWSKELILESGMQAGPQWAYWLLVVGTGITGYYSIRMVWMTFFGASWEGEQLNDAAPFMRVALSVLAVGAISSWLLYSRLFTTISDGFISHDEDLLTLVREVVSNGMTWAVLAIILLGAGLWLSRHRLVWLNNVYGWVSKIADASFGFEWLNQQVIRLCDSLANVFRKTQTGILNWNVFGITIGLLLVMIYLTLWK